MWHATCIVWRSTCFGSGTARAWRLSATSRGHEQCSRARTACGARPTPEEPKRFRPLLRFHVLSALCTVSGRGTGLAAQLNSTHGTQLALGEGFDKFRLGEKTKTSSLSLPLARRGHYGEAGCIALLVASPRLTAPFAAAKNSAVRFTESYAESFEQSSAGHNSLSSRFHRAITVCRR